MNIQINNINIRYQEGAVAGVQVYFNGSDNERAINLNGYVPLTPEEYAGNESIANLTTLVRQKVNEKLNTAE
jgi:hypothetical protein